MPYSIKIAVFFVLLIGLCTSQEDPIEILSTLNGGFIYKIAGTVSRGIYDGTLLLSKTWQMEGTLRDTNRTFYYKDGTIIVCNETGQYCLHPVNIPPLEEIFHSILGAVRVPRDSVVPSIADQCSGDFVRVSFTGISYLICVSQNRSITIFSDEFVARMFRSVIDPLNITFNCPTSQKRSVEAIREENNQASDHWWKKKLELHETPQKPCIFLHGSGSTEVGPSTDTFPAYWGSIESYTPQCSSRKFIHEETKHYGWDNTTLQDTYCALALSDQPPGETKIQNKIIFAHSMGNLVFAAALLSGRCSLGEGSSWYSAMGPVNGSSLDIFLEKACGDPGLYHDLVALDGSCDGNQGTQAYRSMAPSYPGLAALRPIAMKQMKGIMCGTSAYGLDTLSYSASLSLLAKMGDLESPNDGLVWYSSCMVMNVTGTDPTGLFYQPAVNHADGTCRNGNGWWGINRRPCDWYTNKM